MLLNLWLTDLNPKGQTNVRIDQVLSLEEQFKFVMMFNNDSSIQK
jgi:hypothetical protein